MTDAERNLLARLVQSERRNRYLKRANKRMATQKRQAVDAARFLHGVLIAHGIELPNRRKQ